MSRDNEIGVIQTSDKKEPEDHDTSCRRSSKIGNFDDAITATGYGKFHFLLYLAIIPISWASSFDTSNMSMIFTSAECDLKLTLFHKGVLNSTVYVGMVLSGIMWGYIADVKGRRSIIVYGFLADGVCNLLAGFSQNFWTLVCFKFISGLIISGPHATIISYYSEFYRTKDRAKITLLVAFSISSGSVVNAALAWLVIPQDWSLVLWNGYIVYNSWRIFLSLCAVPTLFGCFYIQFFPESPKFLMAQGQNEEALKVFKRIYKVNTGRPSNTYPIHVLENEAHNKGNIETSSMPASKISGTSFKAGLHQMKAIFCKVHVVRLLLVISMQFCTMLALNTIRLWQPQLFTMLANADSLNSADTNSSLSFCEIMNFASKVDEKVTAIDDATAAANCTNLAATDAVYRDTMIISSSAMVFLLTASAFVNLFGHRNLLFITYGISIFYSISVSWSTNGVLILVLTALFIGLMSTTANVIVGVTVLLFPTTLRTMAVCLVMMMGRIGSLIGNLVFPILLSYGCMPAMVTIACLPLACILLTYLIPNTKQQKVNRTIKS